MNPSSRRMRVPLSALSIVTAALITTTATAAELVGFALMPANTFAEGPTSGQFAGAGAGGNALPLINKQPVQGFSAVMHGPTSRSFYVMPDNGFGAKTNSADALLRIYAVRPGFKAWNGKAVTGSGTVSPADFESGRALTTFNKKSFLSLRDPEHKIGFNIVAGMNFYPNGSNNIPVDPSIKAGRLLTGADFDIESVRMDRKGHIWFGDEFGPFLVEADARGRVVHAEYRTPNIVPPKSTATGAEVMSPANPYLGTATPNIGGSNGFEGMAINPAGDRLYTLLEGTVTGDNSINGTVRKNLRINEFDIRTRAYTQNNWLYQLEAAGTAIGDMTAINDHQFLVIERNGATATNGGTPFKKIFIADIQGVANGEFVRKTELVDLMNISDPHDLNGDGSTTFTFPFVTIESVLILNRSTLLVINDNNYPGAGGRDLKSDNTEFLKIRLDSPLAYKRADRDEDEDEDRDDEGKDD
ncbi:MAG: esterase-like activity of phytase family protein [Burkholderiales bacterium]